MKYEDNNITKKLKVNLRLAENQEEYQTLPVHYTKETGQMCFARKISFKEWITLLFTRKILISQLTFNKPLQPIRIDINEKDFQDSYEYNYDWLIGGANEKAE